MRKSLKSTKLVQENWRAMTVFKRTLSHLMFLHFCKVSFQQVNKKIKQLILNEALNIISHIILIQSTGKLIGIKRFINFDPPQQSQLPLRIC